MINRSKPNHSNSPGLRGKFLLYERPDFHEVCQPDVSILTPYFNTADIFAETYNSLFNQSLQNWEWIIVDDGSTNEDSLAQLKKIARSDERITLFSQENSGPSVARNKAFHNSNGRYLCLLDSDDMLEPTYLEKCIWFLDSNPEFSFCNSWSVLFGEQEDLWVKGFERGEEILHNNLGPINAVIRREAFAASGGFDEEISLGHEDWDFWLKMASRGYWGYTLPEFLQWIRKSSSGRYEQIMRSDGRNAEFERYIQDKYRNLAGQFPTPQLRRPQPFVVREVAVSNQLAKNRPGKCVMFIVQAMVNAGAGQHNLDLIAGLVNRGYGVTVCATIHTEHKLMHRYAELTPDVFVLPDFIHLSDFPSFLNYLISSRNIDTVVVNASPVGYNLLPYLRTASPHVSFVDLCHSDKLAWRDSVQANFAIAYHDLLDLSIITQAELSGWLEDLGADMTRIRLLPPGYDENDISEIAGGNFVSILTESQNLAITNPRRKITPECARELAILNLRTEFHLNDMQKRVDELTRRIADLQQSKTAQDNLLDNMLTSTSWKITKPLRDIGTHLKKIKS